MNNKKKLVLVDGQGLLYRSFYALPQLTTSYGQIVNAVYGFTMILMKILDEEKPDYILIAFDTPKPTFRHKEYEEYKAHRKKMPDELICQIPLIKKIIENYRISTCSIEGYEADDILGTITKEAEKRNIFTLIITGDRDAFQLISPFTNVMTPVKGITEVKIYDEEIIKSKYGFSPNKIIEILALKGDSSDNIPGVPGIGEKTAISLIKEYGNIENLMENVDKISNRSLRDRIVEYKDQMQMSKKLATILTDIPIEKDLDAFKIKVPDYEELWKIYDKLEFKNLLKKIAPKIHKKNTEVQYRLIDTKEKLEELCKIINKNIQFSFYLVTSSHDPISSTILGITFSIKGYGNFYIPISPINLIERPQCLSQTVVIGQLRIFFENEKISKIGHNLKNSFIILKRYQIEIKGSNFDTMVASYLLNPSKEEYSLKNLFWEYLEYLKNEDKQNKENSINSIENACENAQNIFLLKEVLEKKLIETELISLFKEIEMPLIEVLAEMEINGIKIDVNFLKKMQHQIDSKLKLLEDSIYNFAETKFNINSPKQLSEILFEKLKLPVIKKTKTGYSTDAYVLNTLAAHHKIVAFILEYRELCKLKNTYIEKLPLLVNKKTNRLHTSFHQTITSTGRLSSSEPNLQNIPIRTEVGREIRRAFIPEKRFKLLSADYSQIELRILAHLSEDNSLINAFKNNEDIHSHTAADMFELDQDLINEKMRRMAKTINFGIIYGMSSFGLARNLGIGREEAEKYIYNYFQKYKGIKNYIEKVIKEARNKGYVITLCNRRRYLDGINSKDKNIREFNERMAINAPIQGTAADLIKLAMVKISKLLQMKKYQSRLLLQIHDELVFEVCENEIEEIQNIIKDTIENELKLSVPLKVNLKIGDNWAELS